MIFLCIYFNFLPKIQYNKYWTIFHQKFSIISIGQLFFCINTFYLYVVILQCEYFLASLSLTYTYV